MEQPTRIAQLREAIASGQVVFITGTGVSVAAFGPQEVEGHIVAAAIHGAGVGRADGARRRGQNETKSWLKKRAQSDDNFLVRRTAPLSFLCSPPARASEAMELEPLRLPRDLQLTPEQRRGFPPLCPDPVVELASPSDEGPRSDTALRHKMGLYQANGARLEADEPFPGLVLELEEIWVV